MAPLPFLNVTPKRSLGIHVGPAQVKLVEMERGKQPTITKILWEATPPEAYVGNRLENPSALATTLVRMLQGNRIKTRHTISSVDGSEVIARTITLPNMPIRELRKAIMFETEASLPAGTGDTVLDYTIQRTFTSDDDSGEKVEVLILSAQKQPLGLLVEAFLEAGLRPSALDLTPLAAHRAEKRSSLITERGTDYIQITINDKCTDLAIIFEGEVRLIRSIPIGSVGLVDALGEKHLFDAGLDVGGGYKKPEETGDISASDVGEEDMGITRRDEEDLEFGAFGEDPFSAELSALTDESLSHESGMEVDELVKLSPLITELVDETLNTIRYGQSFGKERSEIGFCLMNGYFPYGNIFIKSVSDKLGIPVIQGDPFSDLVLPESGYKEDLVNYFAPDFSVAVGLALRGIHHFG